MEIILAHANTDFDALAAMLAAAKLYPTAVPILPRTLNRNLREFLSLYKEELPFRPAEEMPKGPLERVILVDTQNLPTLKGLHNGTQILILDHHPVDRPADPRIIYAGEPAGATTTFLVHRLREQRIPVSPTEASLLLLGIYEDTGNLTYNTTTSRDVLAAAWLLERGASLDVVNQFLHRPLLPAQRELYETLERQAYTVDVHGHAILIATARATDYAEELSTIAHKINDLFDPDASFVLVQLNQHVQIIARSRNDAIDVAEVLRPFGGGGHAKAAAALVPAESLEEVQSSLLETLRQVVRPPVTVRQIMSRGVHTLSPDMPLAEAALLMQRWGHEGFPVAQDGRLLGMLTRREVDRALQHKLHGALVRSYMRQGAFAVSPDDSVQRVRQLMMEHDLGQIPVVENDRITGIVTRTDVIRLMAAPTSAAPSSLADRLQAALPPPLLDLLRQASQTADDLGYSLYLVGGFVRDLLLGIPNLDLDLVVEGNAIALARRLAQDLGGKVICHERFGTAKWLVPMTGIDDLQAPRRRERLGDISDKRLASSGAALVLDFVTARTEFYEHPAALPTVEASSLRQDLYRRDFTINTMALRLDRQHFGQLVDFYGGKKDLDNRLIRVLHNLSFVEDATRMLRAVRLEQRLGFTIEKRTEELMVDALDLLNRVSGERLRHELYLSLQEAEPERILQRLDGLGILKRLHPALRADERLIALFCAAREHFPAWSAYGLREDPDNPYPLLPVYLGLMTYHLTSEELAAFIRRLSIVAGNKRYLQETHDLQRQAPALRAEALSRSAIYRLLCNFSLPPLYVVWLAEGEIVRRHIDLYMQDLRHVKPVLDGHALKSFGLKPGPMYRRVLTALLEARLDGRVRTREEEEAMARAMIQTEQQGSQTG